MLDIEKEIYTLGEVKLLPACMDDTKELVFVLQVKKLIEKLTKRIYVLEGWTGQPVQTLKERLTNQYITIDFLLKEVERLKK